MNNIQKELKKLTNEREQVMNKEVDLILYVDSLKANKPYLKVFFLIMILVLTLCFSCIILGNITSKSEFTLNVEKQVDFIVNETKSVTVQGNVSKEAVDYLNDILSENKR